MCGSISPSRLMYWYPKSLIPFAAIASATDMISLEVQTSLPQLGRGDGRGGCGGCTTLRKGVWWVHHPQKRGVWLHHPQ